MNRRQFLQAGVAGTIGAATAGRASDAFAAHHEPPFLDKSKLEARNYGRSTLVCQNGVVASSQPLATMVGVDVLKAGGNCIDAAIATNAMLGVTESSNNGIGGDLFAILWIEKEQKLVGLNASGRAPYEWNLDEAKRRGIERIPSRDVLAWTVPGCVSGWGMLSERFGAKSLAECLAPSIDYARNGHPLSPIVATSFQWIAEGQPHMAEVYHPGGTIPQYGDVFKNPLLAKSYEAIAKDGPAAFYEGEIAERIVAKAKELGGYMRMRDLADHEANWVDPVSTSYRGWDVWEIPPNGQGIAALQILNMLEQFDIASLKPNSAEQLHLFVEAKKLAYEDRAVYYADPVFADVPTDWLISKEYGKQRAALIDPLGASTSVQPGDLGLGGDTIYMSAADGEGNMISLIQSLYGSFGSRICPDEVGFSIQNRGHAFALDPNHRNKLEPHKRPFHTIIPAFMTKDGKPVMAFGVMGGAFQPQGHSQVVMNMIDHGMSPQQAGEQPRLEHGGSSDPSGSKMTNGGRLSFERGIDDAVRLKLAEMGHAIRPGYNAHGGYQAIWRENDPLRYFAGTDPRKDGCAIGW
jgi:gamma-glutamyltranspeptidase/glutathione hydrolase